jgi:hypothetical protein
MRWLFLGCFACTADVTVDGSSGSGAPLDANGFATAFADKYCDQLTTCGGGECPATPPSRTDTTDCTFDATSARACLDAAWTCDDALPVPAVSCSDVFTCAGPTDTGTPTGT